jgi:hypothetical protein
MFRRKQTDAFGRPAGRSQTSDEKLCPNRRFVVFTCLLVGTVAAAYLWAVVFGHGLRGLKSSQALEKQPDSGDLPDANAAFVVALLAYFASALYAWWRGNSRLARRPVLWYAVTGAAGLATLGASLLFI